MSRLDAELRRLYLLPPPPCPDPLANGVAAGGADAVRALVLGVGKPAQWDHVALVWQGVQADFGLPAPAIAVSGTDGHWLWFSLAEAVPHARAAAFVEGLRARYLPQLPGERVVLLPGEAHEGPGAERAQVVSQLPCREVVPGQWSAFVASDLARIFEEEPWLDRPPSPNAQADLLARMAPMPTVDFERALAQLAPRAAAGGPTPDLAAESGCAACTVPASVGADAAAAPGQCGPRAFLRQLMNDPRADLRLRMESAQALLPWSND